MSPKIEDLLSYRRPHGSPGEAAFNKRFIYPIAQEVVQEKTKDGHEVHAFIHRIPKPNGVEPNIAFVAHVDSVHNRQNPVERQKISFDSAREEFFVGEGVKDCLGADDAAGVYVLLNMIEAKVPGMYVFFRGEERGGIGSSWVAENRQDLFKKIDVAIQFDRRGNKSIITQMMCGRTCSDEFAESLSDLLDMGHVNDDSGSFTDTANLASIVRECTNVSVGYRHEHSPGETLDWAYLQKLTAACIKAFAQPDLGLQIEREAGDFSTGSGFAEMSDSDLMEWILENSPNQMFFALQRMRDEARWFHRMYGTSPKMSLNDDEDEWDYHSSLYPSTNGRSARRNHLR